MSWKVEVVSTKLESWTVLLWQAGVCWAQQKEGWRSGSEPTYCYFFFFFSPKDLEIEAANLNYKCVDPHRRGKYCIAFFFSLLISPIGPVWPFCFSKTFRKRQDAGYVHGCWTCHVLHLSTFRKTFCDLPPGCLYRESWYWYWESSKPRGWSLCCLGWRCQLNVITNKVILIEYVSEL